MIYAELDIFINQYVYYIVYNSERYYLDEEWNRAI